MAHFFWLWISICLASGIGDEPGSSSYRVEKLPAAINSSDLDETNPIVSEDGKTLYFTRVGSPAFEKSLMHLDQDLSRTLSLQEYSEQLKKIYSSILGYEVSDPVRSEANQDIWIARLQPDSSYHLEHPGYPLNNALPNSICAVSPDQQTLYVINQFDPDGSLRKGFSVIRKIAEGWSFPEGLQITGFYSRRNEVNMHLHSSGDIMILSLEQQDSRGSNDLYISQRISGKVWSAPLNLGPVINSPYRESTPFLSNDGQFLFFASNRPGGKGGMDIWVSHRNGPDWEDWSTPSPMIAPINSEMDESQPFWNEASNMLYFTSRRDGSSDIFRARIQAPQKDIAQNNSIRCTVIHARTRELLAADLIFSQPSMPDFKGQYYSPSGKATIRLFDQGPMIIRAEKEGFRPAERVFDPSTLFVNDSNAYQVTLELEPLEVPAQAKAEPEAPKAPELSAAPKGLPDNRFSREVLKVDKAIQLMPIYFVKAKAIIQEQSFPELDRLAQTLKDNPDVHIRIDGYTDNFGDIEALMKLSYDRAAALRRYLEKKGIASYRIQTRGRGPANPVTDNSTEEAKQANRRVEVIVTKRN